MAIRFLTILLSTFFLTSFVHAQEHVVVRSDWKKFFSDLQAEGAIVIADERQAEHALLVFGQERAAKRYSPASTFKLPHTLFALDAGAVRDEFQVFRATIKTKTCDQRCEILRSGFMSYLQKRSERTTQDAI